MIRGWKTKPCAHQDRGKGAVTTRVWTSPAFECWASPVGARVSSDLLQKQALASADLGGAACGIRPLGGGHHSVQSLRRVWLFATLWTAACQASLSITNSWSLLRLMPIASVMPSNHLIYPLSSPSPRAFNLSQHQGPFRWISSLHQVTKVSEFQLQHQSFQWIVRADLL